MSTLSPPENIRKKAWFGWCMYDWANSAFATVIMAAVFPVYFAAIIPDEGARISLFGFTRDVPAAALWGYVVSISMVAVAFSAPYLGTLADHRGGRRRFLLLFTVVGAFATTFLGLAGPGDYLLAGAFFILANFCFASGNVFYNAFLPGIAREGEMDRLSAHGFAYGYLGGGLLLAFVFILIQWHEAFGFAGAGEATRFGLVLTGIWWGVFSIPTFAYVREEALTRPPGELLKGIRGYLRTFAEMRGYRDLIIFLVAFFFYNDGIQTVIVVSAIFAREELGLSQTSILGCFLMIQFVAMPGALFFGRLAERIGAKRAILISLVLFTGVTICAYFIHTDLQFWALAFVVALIYGGSQAISRSLFGALIPEGKNAKFFGFYALSSKFSSILGPLLFAVITDLTRSARLSIVAVAFFFIVGGLLLTLVNVERGKTLARSEAP